MNRNNVATKTYTIVAFPSPTRREVEASEMEIRAPS